MNPTHLRVPEIDYELSLRGIFNLSSLRAKTGSLRTCLEKEKKGLECAPKSSAHICNSVEEIKCCTEIYEEVVGFAEEALKENCIPWLQECVSRLLHIQLRVERIHPSSQAEVPLLEELANFIYEALYRASVELNKEQNAVTERRNYNIGPTELSDREFCPNSEAISNSNPNVSSNSIPTASYEPNVSVPNRGAIPKLLPGRTQSISLRPSSPEKLNFDSVHSSRESLFGLGATNSNVAARSSLNPKASLFPPPPSYNIRSGTCKSSNVGFSTDDIRNHIGNRREKRNLSQINNNSEEQNNLRALNEFLLQRGRIVRDEWGVQNKNDYGNQGNTVSSGLHHQQPMVNHGNTGNAGRQYYAPIANQAGNCENCCQGRESEDRRPSINPTRYGTHRKSVPVHQWRIQFSGDNRGLHLQEFITQVKMYQRAEKFSDEDLLDSVVHLLTGRARLWYQSQYDSIATWEEFLSALKEEFLPNNYDFTLFSDIDARVQRHNESSAEFILHMTSLFKLIAFPLSEEHKLHIVQKNLLPRYSLAVAPLGVRTLKELGEVCRRIDGATSNRPPSNSMPFRQFLSDSGNNRFNRNVRNVDVVDSEEDLRDGNIEPEDFEIFNIRIPRRNTPRVEFANPVRAIPVASVGNRNPAELVGNVPLPPARNNRNPFEQREVVPITPPMQNNRNPFLNRDHDRQPGEIRARCWNCGEGGHIFRDCVHPKQHTFCFSCGQRDAISSTCRRCAENRQRESENNRGNRNPQN